MLEHYHDKYPIGQKLQDLAENQAAFDMLKKKGAFDYDAEKPKLEKKTILLVWCLVSIYLIVMILSTYFAKLVYEKIYEQNISSAMRYIKVNFDKNNPSSLNGIYNTVITLEEYQYISAIVYDENDEAVAVTDLYLCLIDNDTDKDYVYLAEDIFEEHTIMELLTYARVTSEKYTVKADIDGKTNQLLSLKFVTSNITGSGETVWEWQSEDTCDKEQLITIQIKTPIREIFSMPYKYNLDVFEKWTAVKFMYNTDFKVEPQVAPTVTYEDSSFSSRNVGYVQTISDVDENGYLTSYYMHVQSIGHSLKAALEAMAPMYVLGGIVLIVCISLAIGRKKNFKGKRLVILGVFLITMTIVVGNCRSLHTNQRAEKSNEKFGIKSEVVDFNEESFQVEFDCEGFDTEEHIYVDTGPWHEIEKRTIFGWVKKELLEDGWMVGVVNKYDITEKDTYKLDVYYKWYYGKLRKGTYRVTNVIKTDDCGEEECVGYFYTTFKVK